MSSQTPNLQFCVNCGEKLPALAGFCVHCGAAIPGFDQTDASSASATPSGPASTVSSALPTPPPTTTASPPSPVARPITPPTSSAPSSAAGLLLPPVALPRSIPSAAPGASPLAPPVAKGKSWFLWVVGGSLLVVLLLAGYRLLPKKGNLQPRLATTESAAPQAVATTKTKPTPNKPTAPQPLDTKGIAGIESIPLDAPQSYLPYINTVYRHSINFPDGDSGQREMTVAAAGNPGVVTTIELTHSNLYPNDPPGLWIYHYAAREDGLYRISDEDPSQADLYLPNDLAVGKRWKNSVGSFEVTEFDTTITVTGQEFRGVLAYRLRNPELDLDQTTWLAPGYGEVLIKQGSSGSEICRLLGSDPKDPNTVEALVKKHVVNLKKVR